MSGPSKNSSFSSDKAENVLVYVERLGIYAASSLSPLKATLAVAGGLTHQIDVVHINPATREFELTTTLR